MFSFFKKPVVDIKFDWVGIDIHSHLLPGLDDGSPDVETSVDFISQLVDLGFSSFVCTPHIFMELYPNNRKTISGALALLNSQPFIKNNGIRINAAAEYMIDQDFGRLLENGDMMVLPNNYILIEMSWIAKSPGIEAFIFDLQIKGYKPILAHPERYVFYHQSWDELEKFKNMGCLMQLNLLSVTGYYGPEVKHLALNLLKQNLYDLAGTDCHHQKHIDALRSKRMWKDAYTNLSRYPFKNKEIFG